MPEQFCDFCRGVPTRVVRCKSFDMLHTMGSQRMRSIGDWLACDDCVELIDDLNALTNRAIASFVARNGASDHDDVIASYLLATYQTMTANRDGPIDYLDEDERWKQAGIEARKHMPR